MMLCPYCKQEMIPGIIETSDCVWIPQKKRRLGVVSRSIQLSHVTVKSFGTQKKAYIRSYYCKNCEVVIVPTEQNCSACVPSDQLFLLQ